MSNAERQRNFRDRNPGYYNKYYARRKADWERHMLACQKASQERIAAQKETEAALLDPATCGLNVLSEHMV